MIDEFFIKIACNRTRRRGAIDCFDVLVFGLDIGKELGARRRSHDFRRGDVLKSCISVVCVAYRVEEEDAGFHRGVCFFSKLQQ